jgi:hypothetical protein
MKTTASAGVALLESLAINDPFLDGYKLSTALLDPWLRGFVVAASSSTHPAQAGGRLRAGLEFFIALEDGAAHNCAEAGRDSHRMDGWQRPWGVDV